MTEQARLDVLGLQRFGEQRIVHQIDLADREIVSRPPVAVHQGEGTVIDGHLKLPWPVVRRWKRR